MKKNRSFKLLSKTAIVYLVFTFTVLFGVFKFLLIRTDSFIDDELERRFNFVQTRVEKHMKNGGSFSNRSYITVVQMDSLANMAEYPVYSDTTIYSEELQETFFYRQKVVLLEVNDKKFQVSIRKAAGDFYKLRQDISAMLFPAFIFLAVTIVLFNYLLSGFFFKPFNEILEQMRVYQVGAGRTIDEVKTNTHEFLRMQLLFQKMLTRIEKDYQNLKEYTENMAHEIQTPLTIIRNKTENLIADEQLMQNHAADVKIIYDESNNLSSLGSTLNLLTKIENGEFSAQNPIMTKRVIEKHVDAIHESAQLKSLYIEMNLADAHQLQIDPFLLDIILKNLMRNAIRYGSNDGPIRIRTTQNEFFVSNYGAALDVPEQKLFERFYRKDKNTTSLGLGLALVRKICELNAMSINYRYDAGQHYFCIVSERI